MPRRLMMALAPDGSPELYNRDKLWQHIFSKLIPRQPRPAGSPITISTERSIGKKRKNEIGNQADAILVSVMNHPRQSTVWILNLLLLVGSSVVALGLAEIGFRFLSPRPLFGPYFDLRPYKKLQLFPQLAGVSSPAWHTSNRWGLRGDEPPADWESYYTIITIGGSTTQCFYLDDHKTWPYQLQEKLRQTFGRVWVGNAGLDGHSTNGHVLMMRQVIPRLKPDAVILLVGANDLSLSFAEEAERNQYDLRFEQRLNSPAGWLFQHSRLLQVVYVWKRIWLDQAKVVTKDGPPAYRPEKLSAAETTPSDLKAVLPSLPRFRNNVREIIQLARRMNLRAIFLTQPSLYGDDAYWSGIQAQNYWTQGPKEPISAATQWRMLNLFNQELMRTCREQGVEVLDLAAVIPHSFEYFYDPYHFTEAGAELVAAQVAAYLQNLSDALVPRSP